MSRAAASTLAISVRHQLTKAQARQIVDDTLTAIVEAAARADVAPGGFGKFTVKSRPARTGRNPATGEAVKIAASKRLAFAPAKSIRDALNAVRKEKATRAKK